MSEFAWETSLAAALERAVAERKAILADFMKPDCLGCERLLAESFPDPAVSQVVRDHLVPLRLSLDRPDAARLFRENQVIWTPTLVFMDRRGVAHHRAPGYLPPRELRQQLLIGSARVGLAWSEYESAIHLLEEAVHVGGKLSDEALFWQGTAFYLRRRRRAELMRAWGRLLAEYPDSPWAARVPPGQGEPEE